MNLTEEQSREVFRRTGNYLNEVCDRCGKPLAEVRYTRRGEQGESCSPECRDGVKAAPHKARQRACRQCGVSLHGKRADSEFCSDVHRKRFAKSSTSQNVRFIAEMPIGKQGVADAQNAGPMNTLTLPTQAL